MHVNGPKMLQIQRRLVGFSCSNGRQLSMFGQPCRRLITKRGCRLYKHVYSRQAYHTYLIISWDARCIRVELKKAGLPDIPYASSEGQTVRFEPGQSQSMIKHTPAVPFWLSLV